MHGRFGQTLGKMVCKVKVIDKSEKKPITYRQAFLRDSVVIILGLLFTFFAGSGFLDGINPYNRPETVNAEIPPWMSFLSWINSLWFFIEIITMLTNKKRRAVHDFIASSVVVKIMSERVHR